ncbi:MAG: hypothetical protein A2252_09085 [Elusimicrobia bacterium RIFOXYA2_FULL_39_19]|nr:MAG: hypothetical protein A2252_09085 [Elusimicrobia bacterium RIFOXYA2_FULL_39_19]
MKEITLKLYCDEAQQVEVSFSGNNQEKWIYMGILLVPVDSLDTLLNNLLNARCGDKNRNWEWGNCGKINDCKYHEKNNKEVHYSELDDTEKYYIAKRWVDYLLNDKNLIYFYILGLNYSKLNLDYFGDHNTSVNAYNRFFRTAILKSAKSYFYKYDKLRIKDIYHDFDESKSSHEYFPWHSIKFINNKDDKLMFENEEIKFISSSHKKSDDLNSHLIQLIDLITGCTMNCLHNSTNNQEKINISKQFYPILREIIKQPNKKDCYYNCFNRQKVEFFPKNDIRTVKEDDFIKKELFRSNSFYSNREILIELRDQLGLFNNITSIK